MAASVLIPISYFDHLSKQNEDGNVTELTCETVACEELLRVDPKFALEGMSRSLQAIPNCVVSRLNWYK